MIAVPDAETVEEAVELVLFEEHSKGTSQVTDM
jgi:hypothetical protein